MKPSEFLTLRKQLDAAEKAAQFKYVIRSGGRERMYVSCGLNSSREYASYFWLGGDTTSTTAEELRRILALREAFDSWLTTGSPMPPSDA